MLRAAAGAYLRGRHAERLGRSAGRGPQHAASAPPFAMGDSPAASKALPPSVEALFASALLLAERTHRQSTLLLLREAPAKTPAVLLISSACRQYRR